MQEHQALLLRSLLGYAAQRDISVHQLCQLSGVDVATVRQPAALDLSPKQLESLWLNATHLSRDPLFGLHFGESMQLTALGVVGGLLQHSRTIGEALTHAAAFTGLITDLIDMTVSQTPDCFIIQFLPNEARRQEAPAVFRQQLDLFMAFALHEVDGLTLRRIRPRTVSYPVMPAERSELERVFRCDAFHQSDGYALTFDSPYWDEPILTANYALQSLFLKEVSQLNRKALDLNTIRERISHHLLANAYLGLPSLEDMAANFNTSPRNLQRRLQKEGVTYQQLADAIRKSLAIHYLQLGKHPIKEISYILGYNELSAFTRAFKRWTGMAPMHYPRG